MSFGVRPHSAVSGTEDGPLVVLLHGFSEFWYGRRKQLPAVAAAGFRVVAPDQRGYNLSEKPVDATSYTVDVSRSWRSGAWSSLRRCPVGDEGTTHWARSRSG